MVQMSRYSKIIMLSCNNWVLTFVVSAVLMLIIIPSHRAEYKRFAGAVKSFIRKQAGKIYS